MNTNVYLMAPFIEVRDVSETAYVEAWREVLEHLNMLVNGPLPVDLIDGWLTEHHRRVARHRGRAFEPIRLATPRFDGAFFNKKDYLDAWTLFVRRCDYIVRGDFGSEDADYLLDRLAEHWAFMAEHPAAVLPSNPEAAQ